MFYLFKPVDLSAILIMNRTGANAIKQFRVRRKYVRQALVWLKQNHLYYRDITIDELSLETLPKDGIPEDMSHAHEDNAQLPNENQSINIVEDDIEGPLEIVNQNVHIDEFHAVGTIFIGPQPNQQACIQRALHVADADHTIAHMHLTNKVIDEFSTPGYILIVFPDLFPYRNVYFRQARPRNVNPSEYFQYLMKCFDGRFAKDLRFRYFTWNSISRWRALSLGNVYVKKNPSNAEFSIQDIQNMVASGDPRLADHISYYDKSICGTRAYWYTRMKELTAMVKQLGAPTILFYSLAMNDCVNITDLVDEEYEETEDIDLESEGVLLEEWMLATSMRPMFDYGEDVELGLRDFDTSHNWRECLERYPNIDIDRKFIHNHLRDYR
ncbi:Uncharacterized protein Adt_14272 [Abeliophyllum distichum]|uniref:Uncharacterized protein n=1 Tax=Abeliophyllum distichum TaxID=126358 RepID=A0ABD1TZ58_9LAMI